MARPPGQLSLRGGLSVQRERERERERWMDTERSRERARDIQSGQEDLKKEWREDR